MNNQCVSPIHAPNPDLFITIDIPLPRGDRLSAGTMMTIPWWRHQMQTFSRHWPFVRGIHGSPVNSPGKGQWRGAFMFSLICAWLNGWVNNRLWRHCNILWTLGSVRIDPETHKSDGILCTTGKTWKTLSWHETSMFQLLSHMLS